MTEVKLKFKKELTNKIVPLGKSTAFSIELYEHIHPSLKVTWYRNEEEVSNDDNYRIINSGNKFRVDIKKVTEKDEGSCWFCAIQTVDGAQAISSQATLNVIVPENRAPEFLKPLRGCLWDNGTLSLECEVLGEPTPELRWYKDGEQLLPGAALKIRANSKERRCFLGVFACEAENCMGVQAIFSKVYAIEFGKFIRQFHQ